MEASPRMRPLLAEVRFLASLRQVTHHSWSVPLINTTNIRSQLGRRRRQALDHHQFGRG